MRGHGNVVVGPNVRRVVARAIYTEVNARLQLQAITLGSPIIYIDETEARAGEANRDNPSAATASTAPGRCGSRKRWADPGSAGR